MAEMQNTGNALPSNDLKDFNDNLIVLDNQMNSQELVTVDRFGRQITTVKGMEKTIQDLASNISTDKLVPIDGSRAADKLTLKDGDVTITVKASSGELAFGDKQALLTTETDGVKTVTAPTNFTGELQQNGSDVVTKAMNVAYVTEAFLSDDGLSGYEKWSNGKIVQWGRITTTGVISQINLLYPIINILAASFNGVNAASDNTVNTYVSTLSNNGDYITLYKAYASNYPVIWSITGMEK